MCVVSFHTDEKDHHFQVLTQFPVLLTFEQMELHLFSFLLYYRASCSFPLPTVNKFVVLLQLFAVFLYHFPCECPSHPHPHILSHYCCILITLEKEMATHSNILACRIPWTRSLAGYSPWGRKRVTHDLVTEHVSITCGLVKYFPWVSFWSWVSFCC